MSSDPFAAFRLDGRVAIVTGASSGIGQRFVRVLHSAGASVVTAARRVERLEALAAELDRVTPVACDVTVDADLERLVATALDQHGKVDVLVNNAGITDPLPAEEEPPALFRRIIDVNLTSAFVLTQLVARGMLERGDGTVINVASVLGMVGVGQIPQASYTASKGGIINMTRELAAQWGRRGVRVNAIAPGWFPTEMTGDMFGEESGINWIRRKTPMGRGGELHELDAALLFLAGAGSSYVTGQVIAVDGGYTAI